MNKPKLIKLSDIIFTAAIIGVASLALFLPVIFYGTGTYVVVRQNGQKLARLELKADNLYEVNGKYKNVIEVKDGAVSVIFSDCPAMSCVKRGAINMQGEVIACAPNGVTVTIEGSMEGADAITG